MVTFIRIRSPPRTLPTPPWRRRRTLCPLLISLSSFFSLFQFLQGRLCLFEVRSVLYWHSIGTCLVWTKPPVTFCHSNILVESNDAGLALYRKQFCLNESTNELCNLEFLLELSDVCGLRPPGRPFGDKFLRFDRCQTCPCGTFRLVWIGRGYPRSSSFCTSSWVNGRFSILCPLASFRNGARGIALSLCSS